MGAIPTDKIGTDVSLLKVKGMSFPKIKIEKLQDRGKGNEK